MLKNRLDWHFSKHCTLRYLLICLAFTLSFSVSYAQDDASADGIPTDEAAINNGKSLFTNNCTVCHAINDQVVGPALKDVHERRDLPWLQSFIKNSQAVIQSGDDYAVNLYNEYNKTLMPAFDFSDEEVNAILAYIKSESEAPAETTADTTAAAGQVAAEGGGGTGGISSEYLTIILVGLLIVLVLILVVLILIISVLTRFLRQKEGLDDEDREILNQQVDVKKVVKSRSFLGISLFLFMAIAVKLVLDGLYSIGIQQGYQPKQPIAFSHALHAGQYQIDCQYCHTGVMKAKSANIPSANICMNCHQQIKPESPEIQKIYAAIDFDPETQTYGNNKKPIEWVRIHNLPDLAYFNHSQHVNVGGLDCETCHGPIQEMEVVYQHSLLTMGWCINCHRETQVNAEGNDYYDKLLELHESAESNEPLRVEDIGGLECSKCHY
jgi:mono/diheme cytochrome c family protein